MNQDRISRADRKQLVTTRFVALERSEPQVGALALEQDAPGLEPSVVGLGALILALAALVVALASGAFSQGIVLWSVLAPFVIGAVALAVSDAQAE